MKTSLSSIAATLVIGLACATSAFAVGDFQLLDDGTGSQMVCTDGNRAYVLKQNGNVWENSFGQWNMIDNGTGSLSIAADSGYVYVLKQDGSVWQRAFGQWNRIGSAGSRQMVAAGTRLFTLESNDDVFEFNPANWFQKWSKIDNGSQTRMIAADRQGNCYVLKNTGNIFRWLGAMNWDLLDNGTGTDQIAASDGRVYALKNTGNIFRYWGQWGMIDDGQGTKQIKGDGAFFYALKQNGNTWMFRDERWSMVDNGAGTRMIDAKDGDLLVMKDNGNVFLGHANTFQSGPFAPQVTNFNQLHGN